MEVENGRLNNKLSLPEGTGEEFSAALEASTGRLHRIHGYEPLSEAQIVHSMEQVLLSPRPDRGLEVLIRSGIIGAVLPEVEALVGFGEGIRHKDVWAHTKQVIRQAPVRPIVRWAALLHDIGKVPTRRFEQNGQVTFIGHPEVGARMFDRISRRLHFECDVSEPIRFLIASHLRASAYDNTWTDSAVRRFARDVGENLEDLLDLSRADITSKYEEKVRRGLRQIDILAERIERITKEDARPAPLPRGLGQVLIERLNIPPGPGLGRLMNALKDEAEAGRVEIQQDFTHYLDYIESNPAILEVVHFRNGSRR